MSKLYFIEGASLNYRMGMLATYAYWTESLREWIDLWISAPNSEDEEGMQQRREAAVVQGISECRGTAAGALGVSKDELFPGRQQKED